MIVRSSGKILAFIWGWDPPGGFSRLPWRKPSSLHLTSPKRAIISGQIIATSHDLTPNGGLVREIPLFQGNPGWWNIIIWPDYMNSDVHHLNEWYSWWTTHLTPVGSCGNPTLYNLLKQLSVKTRCINIYICIHCTYIFTYTYLYIYTHAWYILPIPIPYR